MIKYIKPVVDLVLTLVFWTYFTLGFVLFFSPFFFAAFLFSRNREISFQKLNCLFYKGFFMLVRILTPGLSFNVHEEVFSIRSSVIVCNHLSYLDPILLISLFEKHKTIVKSTFFKVPIFGWFLKISGYLPSATGGRFGISMLEQIESMEKFLASGGNFFIFPEGTRSRNGKLGSFNKGAFKIARRCNAPVKVLLIRNSNALFRPGKFLFNTCVPNTIEVKPAGGIDPDYTSRDFSISGLAGEVAGLMQSKSEEL